MTSSITDRSRTYDFPKLWRRAIPASIVLVILSLGALLIGGLNLGIDFEGGTSFEVETDASIDEVAAVLPADVAAEARLQVVTDEEGGRFVRVRSSVEDPAEVEAIRNSLAELGEISGFESVGPTWGDEITSKALRALIYFFLAIAAYISIQLEWKMAVGALVAVAHDIIISVGVYAIFRFEVTPATVIAFLTIMGYSLYDTIVVYDKVREITARVGATGRYTYTEMMNLALNQVLTRSINTTISSVLPVASMLIIGSFILGATTLQEFSIALLVGLIVGGYSSLFVASAVVAWLKEREPEYQQIAKKVAKKTTDEGTRTVAAEDATFGLQANRMRTRRGGSGNSGDAATGTSVETKPDEADNDAPKKPVKSRKTKAQPAATIPPRPRKTKKKK